MRSNWTQVESQFEEEWTKIDLWTLVQKLVQWQRRPGPLKGRLKDAIVELAMDGEIANGTRLPSERDLAQALAVSRNTVAGAYALLVENGFGESRRGSGTVVRLSPENRDAFAHRTRDVDGTFLLESVAFNSADIIDFCIANVELPPRFFPLATLDNSELETLSTQNAYEPHGLIELREAIAADISAKGLPTNADQVLVTGGAQQAINLVTNLFLRRGDVVALENPTFFVALDLLRIIGARFTALPPSSRWEALRETLVHANARMMYLIPTHQNPTGRILSTPQRAALAAIAGELQIPVIEDTAIENLSYDGSVPPQIASFSKGGNIVTVGSLNKEFWSGVRIGWVRADESIIARLTRLKTTSDLATPPWTQTVALKAMRNIAEVRDFRRAEFREKLEFATGLLRKHLPEWEFEMPHG